MEKFSPHLSLLLHWPSHLSSSKEILSSKKFFIALFLFLLLHWPSHLTSSKEILSLKSFSLLYFCFYFSTDPPTYPLQKLFSFQKVFHYFIFVFTSPRTLPPIPFKRNVHRKEKSMFKSLSLSHLSQSKRFKIMVFLLRLNICIFIEEVLLQHLKCRHFSISFLRIFSISKLLYFLSFYFLRFKKVLQNNHRQHCHLTIWEANPNNNLMMRRAGLFKWSA